MPFCKINLAGKLPVNDVSRESVTSDVQVYMTHGSYDDHGDHLMDYVKNGGGLIIGGHAWEWALRPCNRKKCYMLKYPGNKIISRIGIVFSTERVHEKDAVFRIDKVPALKHSLYYSLKAYILRPSVFYPLDFRLPINNNTLEDIKLFSNQLGTNEFFRVIFLVNSLFNVS